MSSAQNGKQHYSYVVLALDLLVLLLVVAVVALEVTGGFNARVHGIRISAHRPDRAVLAALVVLGVRLLISRQLPRFGPSREQLHALRDRLYRPSHEPLGPPSTMTQSLLALAGLSALCVVLCWSQIREMYSVSDLGDPLFSMWRMGWLFHWLHGDPRPLFSPNIFYPTPLTLTFSDSMLIPSAMAIPLLAAGVHPVVAYNIVLLASFVLSGFTMYLLVVRLTGSARAGFIAGILFAFYPFRFQHYPHYELQMTFWMPLALLWIHRFLITTRARYAIAAALCAVAQLYSSMYFALFFLLYSVPVVGVLVLLTHPPVRQIWRPALAAGVLAIALVVPLARPYLAAQGIKGERDRGAVAFYSATPIDYLKPHPRSATWWGVMVGDPKPERELFPGFAAPILAAAALVPPVGPMALAYGAGLVFAFDGSLGFNGVTYPYLYDGLSPIRGMRVPARFAMIVGMTLAILAGFACRRLFTRLKGIAGHVAFVGLILAAGIDLRADLDLVPVWRTPPPIYAPLAGPAEVVLAEYPLHPNPEIARITPYVPYMYFSLWHWQNMVEGYSGFSPPDFPAYADTIVNLPDGDAIEALKARKVTHVTVNCALYGADCHSFLAKLDASPHLRLMLDAKWEGDTARLYEFLP